MKSAKLCSVAAAFAAAFLVFSCASTGGSGGGGFAGGWNFDDPAKGTDRWGLARSEFYQYTGDIAISQDSETFGDGKLRIDLDFSAPENQKDWCEPKLVIDLPRSINIGGFGSLAYDFYFDPSARNQGNFQTKIFTNTSAPIDANGGIPSSGEELENGFTHVEVVIPFKPTKGFITDLRLSIVGSGTDYVGPVFIDNIRFLPIE
ncbi:hypothetical protein AGMMS4952_15100 [Spirochaetia bacterium]|nr:hypothetical protein AGMMS4952_15100 [Spirochaetia bacterium]